MRKTIKDKNRFFKQLFDQYSRYGLSIALRFVRNREDALEVVNDSFLKLFTTIDDNVDDKKTKALFRRIVINTAIDQYRKNSRNHDNFELNESICDEKTINIEQKLSAEEILNALHHLTDIQRIIFTLYEIEGYNHEEISIKLGVNVSTCRSHLRRAKNKLQEILHLYERELG
ncbi:MAG: RNA polymerase sigma factor [Prolixibacteraceae bacterium]|nr:RNA polymerase sigma factor [Prolixibacteraceae bacterium]